MPLPEIRSVMKFIKQHGKGIIYAYRARQPLGGVMAHGEQSAEEQRLKRNRVSVSGQKSRHDAKRVSR